MITLRFSRSCHRLLIDTGNGNESWHEAHNNVDSRARGRWPLGTFEAEALIPVTGLPGEPSGAYGPWFVRFDVPGRFGMGLHAGRVGQYDGLGRGGEAHATMGCIRTTDEAMGIIAAAWTGDGTLTVEA